ncbi:unnamed protein product, partial [Iphiclides podalirius]
MSLCRLRARTRTTLPHAPLSDGRLTGRQRPTEMRRALDSRRYGTPWVRWPGAALTRQLAGRRPRVWSRSGPVRPSQASTCFVDRSCRFEKNKRM